LIDWHWVWSLHSTGAGKDYLKTLRLVRVTGRHWRWWWTTGVIYKDTDKTDADVDSEADSIKTYHLHSISSNSLFSLLGLSILHLKCKW